jgi:hypothetical protein
MQESCGTFRVGPGTLLWGLLPVTARRAEYFLVQAAPDNPDIVSISGNIVAPGERRALHRDGMQHARVTSPDPACRIEVFAVLEGR